MDFDPRDFYDDHDDQFADEMEAMGNVNYQEETDPWSSYKVSDDLLKRAMEEEAQVQRDKENRTPNTLASKPQPVSLSSKPEALASQADNFASDKVTSCDPLERQLATLRESMAKEPSPGRSSISDLDNSYPVIEFSFMGNTNNAPQTPPAPIQISNAFKRKSATFGAAPDKATSVFGKADERVKEEEAVGTRKRARTDPQSEKIHTRMPAGDFIRVATDTQKVYLKVKPFIAKVTLTSAHGTFLAQPFQYLKSQVMRNYYDKKKEVAAAVERIRSHVVPAVRVQQSEKEKEKANLWVNTYLPNRYVDLLSDDGVNREVLHWLKLWDGVVYGQKMKDKAPVAPPKWMNMEQFQRNKQFQEPDYDERGFPFKKSILLAGPPGLGKTTLAHVVAVHGGYNVVEMNASDDRSAAQFAEMIENATRMTAALTKDNRPNCLIIDEIDGAGAPAIQVLIKVLTAGTKKRADTDPKKKKKERRLRRPIICICNDAYVPALRDLRKITTIITFPQTQSARLAYRLKSICTVEALTADMASLLYLCEKTENDIRSSLNTLQFLKARNEPLSMVKLKTMNVGAKDMQQSLFKFWATIFTLPRTKTNALQRAAAGAAAANRHDQQRLLDLIKLVSSTGEYDRQVEGVHENLLHLKIREANFPALADSLDWFTFYDMLGQEIRKTMVWDLYTYLMYVPMAFHFLFAMVHPPKVVFPSSARTTRQLQQETQETADMMRREALPKARLDLTSTYITTELSSYLARMLCPAFRPVNIQLYSDKEKKAKTDLVNTMACYDLQFVQCKTPEGLTQFALEPNLYKIASFSDSDEVRQLPYSVKQMLAREVDMKRITIGGGGGGGGLDTSIQEPTQNKEPSNTEQPNKAPKIPKIDFSKETAPINYLAKVVGNKEAFNRKTLFYVQKDRTFFKFNEGFSNAVRKPVKMSAFF